MKKFLLIISVAASYAKSQTLLDEVITISPEVQTNLIKAANSASDTFSQEDGASVAAAAIMTAVSKLPEDIRTQILVILKQIVSNASVSTANIQSFIPIIRQVDWSAWADIANSLAAIKPFLSDPKFLDPLINGTTIHMQNIAQTVMKALEPTIKQASEMAANQIKNYVANNEEQNTKTQADVAAGAQGYLDNINK